MNDVGAFVDREEHAIDVRIPPEIEDPNRLVGIEAFTDTTPRVDPQRSS